MLARDGAVTLDSNTVATPPSARARGAVRSARGVGEIDAVGAAGLDAPPNPNENLNAFVVVDPVTGQRTFDDASWVNVVSTPGELVDRELVDRELVDCELVDRQLVDRQLVDRQLVDRQLVDGTRARTGPVGSSSE